MIRLSRVLLGILAASVCASLLIGAAVVIANVSDHGANLSAATGTMLFSLAFGLPVALALSLVIALPAYLLLRRRFPMHWWHAALAGVMIGAGVGIVDNTNWQTAAITTATGLLCGLVFRAIVGPDPRGRASA